jgi:TctA family transporter
MKVLGKTLQLVGLVLLPVAMTLELTGALGRDSGLADMLLMLVFGAVAFTLGRFVEGYAARGGE